jgi:N-acetylglucosaminyl-diphospho-decaprenol L-rhamnosyltransferase
LTARQMLLSVIIVNWNAGRELDACLASASAAAQGMAAEFWLVDNASTDGSAERASRIHPDLHVIENAENVGFARGANQALSRASGELLLLLNPDAQITRDALSAIVAALREDPRIGIVGCASVDASGRWVPGWEDSYPGQRRAPIAQSNADGGPAGTGPLGRDAAWVSGACLLARQAMIEEVGLLDPGFFMYYEDVDWCRRARNAGWRVVTVPGVAIRHDLGSTSAHLPSAETTRRVVASRLRFYRKHYSPARARWLAARMFTSALLGLAWRLACSPFSRRAREAVADDCARLCTLLTSRTAREVEIP